MILRRTVMSLSATFCTAVVFGQQSGQPPYSVAAVPAKNINATGRVVGTGSAIDTGDSLLIHVNGPAMREFLAKAKRPVNGQADVSFLLQQSTRQPLVLNKMRELADAIRKSRSADNANFTLQASSLRQKTMELFEAIATGSTTNRDLSGPRFLVPSAQAFRLTSYAAVTEVHQEVKSLRAALAPTIVDVQWTVTILRDPDTGRTTDVSPLYALEQGSGELTDLASSANQILQQINQMQGEIKNYRPVLERLYADTEALIKGDLADSSFTDPEAADVLTKGQTLLTTLGALKAKYNSVSTVPDAETVVKEVVQVGQELGDLSVAIDNVRASTLKASLKVLYTALTQKWDADSTTLAVLNELSSALGGLNPEYKQIAVISGSATGDLNSFSPILIKNYEGHYVNESGHQTTVAVRSEDEVAIAVQIRPESDGNPDYVQVPPATHLYTFHPTLFRFYTNYTASAVAVLASGDPTWRAGAGSFATFHPVTENASLNMNFGFVFGLGIVQGLSSTSNSTATNPDTAVFAGIGLFRDTVLAGVGWDSVSKRTVLFAGLRLAKF